MRAALVAVVGLFGLACTGVTGGACCSVEDILELQRQGVEPEVMIDAIRTSGTDLALSARDIADLSAAGVDRTVIDVLNGGPCVCADTEALVAEEEEQRGGTRPRPRTEPASLRLKVVYDGGRNFEVVNLSGTTYTNVTVILNGEWQYKLKRLPGGKADSMRFASFRSLKTGEELKNTKLRSVAITAAQGSYSQSF